MPETETNKSEPKAAATIIEPERILDLGYGLELWKVHPSFLREQDVNARAMPKAMFERLAQTIARDKRLESLPLCAKTERGLEIISGHQPHSRCDGRWRFDNLHHSRHDWTDPGPNRRQAACPQRHRGPGQ